MSILLIILCAALVFCGFMLVRNEFVYRARMAFINSGDFPEAYRRLPEYNEMLNKPRYWLLWTPSHWRLWVARQFEAGAQL